MLKLTLERISSMSWLEIILYPIIVILGFAAIFFGLSLYAPEHGLTQPDLTFFDAIYFSVVTYSSLGYGDIGPVGFSRFLAIIEVVLGLIFIGLFVSKLISIRQERMLSRLYHLEYIDFFRGIRNSLSEYRIALHDLTMNLIKDPKNTTLLEEANNQFGRRKRGFVRKISSVFAGCYGFLKHEQQDGYILRELEVYHFERLAHSVRLTLKEIYAALHRLESVRYPISTPAFKENLKFCVDEAHKLLELIHEHYHTKQLDDKVHETEETIKKIEKEFLESKTERQLKKPKKKR